MKIYLATDHAGFELKEVIKKYLADQKIEVEDCGAFAFDKDDDYPDFISKAAEAVSKNPEDKGIIFGGSGQAEAMLANKYKGVRCALFYSPRIPPHPVDVTGRVSADPYEMIKLARIHNNANMLSLGARLLKNEEAIQAVDIWLTTAFDPNSRHARRLEKMKAIEEKF